jgi:hypothetical protein
MASREGSGLLPFVRWRRAWGNPRSLPDQFAGGIVDDIAGLFSVLVVGVDNLVADGIVRPELSFLGELPRGVVLI